MKTSGLQEPHSKEREMTLRGPQDETMKGVFWAIKAVSHAMQLIAALALGCAIALTVADVILRRIRMPIDWCYEIVVLLGTVAIGFSIPQTTLDKAHVRMDFLTAKISGSWRRRLGAMTRLLGIAIFGVFGWRILVLGANLARSGQFSAVLEIPEYPVAYGIGVCCFVVCLVLIQDLMQTLRGG